MASSPTRIIKPPGPNEARSLPLRPSTDRFTGAIRTGLFALAIFGLALWPRLAAAPRVVTADEDVWLGLAANFAVALLQGDFEHTYQIGHPGVTGFWATLAGAGFERLKPYAGLVQYGQHASLRRAAAREPTFLEDLAAARRGHAVTNALLIAALSLLTRRLLGTRPALLAGGLLALDPFLVAHAQVIRMDSLQAGFVTLSVLAAAIAWASRGGGRYLAFGGACLGLALLSKTSSIVALPALLLGAGWRLARLVRAAGARVATVRLLGEAGLFWLAAVGAALLGLPALWSAPQETLARIVEYTRWSSETAPQFGNFFLGQPVATPPGWYYLVVLLYRSTPATLAGLVLLAALLPGHRDRLTTRAPALLCLVALVVVVVAALAPAAKKADRYLLPAWPTLLILAGFGLSQVFSLPPRRRNPADAAALLLLVVQVAWLPPLNPYPLTYYNPLLGGLPVARNVLLVGWGEGLEEAASRLNGLPGAEMAVAATLYSEALRANFRGTSLPLARYAEADYLVDYVNMEQRRLLPPALNAYVATVEPLASISIGEVPFAQIYQLPHIEFGQGLRVDRHLLEGLQASRGERLRVEVHCTALIPGAASWTLRLALLDAEGTEVARGDVAACASNTAAMPLRLALPLPAARGAYLLALSALDDDGRPILPTRLPPWITLRDERAVFSTFTVSVS